MPDPLILAGLAFGAAVSGTTAIQSRRARRAALAEQRRLAAQPKPTRGQLATQAALALKPELFDWDGVQWVRGGHRTTSSAVSAFYARAGKQPVPFAETLLPLELQTTRLTALTGAAGSGKTSILDCYIHDLCQIAFQALPEFRLVCFDPNSVFRPRLHYSVPQSAGIIDFDLTNARGWGWAAWADLRGPTEWNLFVDNLIPKSLRTGSDPFWPQTGLTTVVNVCDCLSTYGVEWTFGTVMRVLNDFGFCRALLQCNPRTRAFADNTLDLTKRIGQNVSASNHSLVRHMLAAGAYDLQVPRERRVSIRQFLDTRYAALLISYPPHLIPAIGGYVNTFLTLLCMEAFKRVALPGQGVTYLCLDEARYSADLSGIDQIAARGRGAGMGAVVSALGLPSLETAFGQKRAAELMSLSNLWCSLAIDEVTAAAFERRAGKYEAWVTGTGASRGTSGGWSRTYAQQGSFTVQGGWTEGQSTSTSLQLRDVVLASELMYLTTPSNPILPDRAHGFGLSADTGCFSFEMDLAGARKATGPVPAVLVPQRPDLPLTPFTPADCMALGIPPQLKPLDDHFNGKPKP